MLILVLASVLCASALPTPEAVVPEFVQDLHCKTDAVAWQFAKKDFETANSGQKTPKPRGWGSNGIQSALEDFLKHCKSNNYKGMQKAYATFTKNAADFMNGPLARNSGLQGEQKLIMELSQIWVSVHHQCVEASLADTSVQCPDVPKSVTLSLPSADDRFEHQDTDMNYHGGYTTVDHGHRAAMPHSRPAKPVGTGATGTGPVVDSGGYTEVWTPKR